MGPSPGELMSRWIAVLLLAACGPAAGTDPDGAEVCGNGADDDGNGLADCLDAACAASCPELCDDGLDNDANGLSDCADAACDGSCSEVCDDGRDNDGDSATDCDDTDCVSEHCAELCDDGRDNDGDGAADCSDADCNDVSCEELCTDARDNDADTAVDCDDADCDGLCPENCEDGRDNDLDGQVDCDDPQCEAVCDEDCLNFVDDDADSLVDCVDPECADSCDFDYDGYLNQDHGGDDCDDTNPDVNPDAREVCNGVDDECDGLADDADPDVDPATLTAWYRDQDVDGFGYYLDAPEWACLGPVDTAPNSSDCDDGNPDVNSAAVEVCDGLDNDCDGLRDDQDPSVDLATATTWYPDADSDGFGDPLSPTLVCNPPVGFVENGDDCDDNDPLLTFAADWLPDLDGDDYGAGVPYGVVSCAAPVGDWAPESHGEDCDDFDPANNPGNVEVCDEGDNDCDALVDDDDASLDLLSAITFYPDDDGDTYGNPSFDERTCLAPDGWVSNGSDCDDSDVDVSPSALEICNGIDDDCDAKKDDADPSVDLSTATDWFGDADTDGYGDPAIPGPFACSSPGPNWAPNALDCDDTDPDIFEGSLWVLDGDGDGYGVGDPSDVTGCEGPGAPWVSLTPGEDCDDTLADIHPFATEVCEDLIDQDCLGGDLACFIGLPGPDFSADGWHQCAGYLDTAPNPNNIPPAWAVDCREADDEKTLMVCGADLFVYRWIELDHNPWRDNLPAYPTIGWIVDDNYGHTHLNQIYATGNDPDLGASWWGTGDGCNEFAANTTVNNGCSWEASNCFGAGLTGDRYLWVYAKP